MDSLKILDSDSIATFAIRCLRWELFNIAIYTVFGTTIMQTDGQCCTSSQVEISTPNRQIESEEARDIGAS